MNILAKLYLNSVFFFFAENLTIDKGLTRREITTFLNHAVNLGCYVTNLTEPTKSELELVVYTWKKPNNDTVRQSSRAKTRANVLVVTPKSPKDFGMYECNVTKGVSSTQCRILLIRGMKYTGEYTKQASGILNKHCLLGQPNSQWHKSHFLIHNLDYCESQFLLYPLRTPSTVFSRYHLLKWNEIWDKLWLLLDVNV